MTKILTFRVIQVGEQDNRLHAFRFIPSKEPGVQADLNGDSKAYQCFFLTVFC